MVKTESGRKLNPGDAAPGFELLGIDGKTYSLNDFLGKEGLLVIFMCNHCPYVLAKIDAMRELYQKFKERVAMIGINSNDPNFPGEGMENMKKFAAEKEVEFPYLFDKTQEVARAYGATCTPDPFLFDKDRKLVCHGKINDAMEPGDPVNENTMEDNIAKLLTGEKIEKPFDPSLGCSIKWLEQ